MDGEAAGRRVLVAEDDWILATDVSSWLADEKMQVLGPAASVQDAERLVRETHPDVAVVDFNLRGETAAALIESLGARNIPVIVVSGYTRSCEVGGNVVAVLEKPCQRWELIGALRTAKLAP